MNGTNRPSKLLRGGRADVLAMYLSALHTDEAKDKLIYLYEKYLPYLLLAAKRIVQKDALAEDAVHNAFLKVIEREEEFLSKSEVDFFRWIVIIVKRKAIDILRGRTRIDGGVSLDSEDAPQLPGEDDPFDVKLIRQEDYSRIKECLRELDPVNRQILIMKYIEDMSIEEICGALNMTLPQVNGRIARTRDKAKKLFFEGGDPYEQ